jgi:hypothetical protein
VAPVMEDVRSGSDTLPGSAPVDPYGREVVDEVRRGDGLRLVAVSGLGVARGGAQRRMEAARRRASSASDCAAAWWRRGEGAGGNEQGVVALKEGAQPRGKWARWRKWGEVGRRETWARGACEERG